MSVRSVWSLIGLSFALAFGIAPDARAHSGSTVDGTLFHQVGNPHPRLSEFRGTIRNYFVRSEDDGHIVPVDLSAAELPPGGISRALNKRVRVTAPPAVAVQALSRTQKMPVQRLDILGASADVQADTFPITGSRKYVSLLCRWSDDTREPRVPSFFGTQLGAVYPGFNHYFNEVSYGLANINSSFAMTQWVAMPHPRTYYDTGVDDGSYLTAMAQDCITAAEAYVDFTGVVGVNTMFNGLVDDCCAWGGGAFLNFAEGGNRSVSVTWMPYWGYFTLLNYGYEDTFGWLEHGVLAHELSHSFGSPHSDDPSGYQYGNYWDVVSHPGGTCITVDATYGCVGQHQVADNKIKMGFIPGGRLATHAVGAAATTYTLERAANPPNAGGTYQYLRINTPDAHKYYTVESRLRTGYDVNLPGDGVIIMDVIDNRPNLGANNPGDDARLITPTGSTAANTGDIDSRWAAGDVYINNTANIKITVLSFDGVTGDAQIKVEPATAPGEYSFALAGYTVFEGGPAVSISVTRTAPFATAGSVVWTTSNGTAIAGSDFGTNGNPAQKSGTLTWTAGTGGTKMITVGLPTSNIPVINEGAAEADETFTVTLSSPVGGVLGAQSATTVTVKDGAVFSMDAPTKDVNENGPNVMVRVNRTGDTTQAHAVTFTTVAGTAIATSDFTAATQSITFLAGETFKDISVGSVMVANPHVHVVNDATIEGPESFTLRLSSATNGAIVNQAAKDTVVTILSDENGVAFGAGATTFSETAGAQNLVVNRSGSAGPVTVNYAFGGGTAVNGDHYLGTNGVLSWADGESGPKNIPFTILDDAVVNTNRTFTVTLSGALGATLVAPTSKTVTIADNDNTVQFTAPTISVSEGGILTLTVSRTGGTAALAAPASVTYTTVNGTAISGTDFGVNGNPADVTGILNWAAGVGGNKTFTIGTIQNALLQGAKTFVVQLGSPTGTAIGANPEVTVTLNDDEKSLFFSSATYNVTETTDMNVLVKVRRGGLATAAASATWTTVNGTAVSGTDFGALGVTAPRTGTISWAIGDTAEKTITIPILSNASSEPTKSFTVTLTPASGGLTLTAPSVATVTIADDDIPPQSLVRFSAPKYVVIEGAPNVQLTLQRVLSGDPTQSFALASSIKYSTVAGSAMAISDYIAATNVTVNWAGGDNADKTITIPIVNNTTAESPEFFKVTLSGPTGAMGVDSPGEAIVWILDDDEAFPLDGAMPAGFSVPGGVTKGWHVSNDPGAYEGFFSLKSDEIDDTESAGVQMSGTFTAPVNVSFRVKVSSEAGFDELQFWLDGVLMTRWSGTTVTGWQASPMYPILPGPHTLKWIYVKDGSVTVGQDAAWIDGLLTPSFTP